MPTDPVPAVQLPKFALSAYTTSELMTRRRELEHAIKTISPAAPIQADLRRWLAEVEDEEQDRARLAAANRRG